jgi:hypothetical protein
MRGFLLTETLFGQQADKTYTTSQSFVFQDRPNHSPSSLHLRVWGTAKHLSPSTIFECSAASRSPGEEWIGVTGDCSGHMSTKHERLQRWAKFLNLVLLVWEMLWAVWRFAHNVSQCRNDFAATRYFSGSFC